MKKIALAIENFSRYGGGAESYAVELAQSLIKDGWEVHCYGEFYGGQPKSATFHHISIPKLLPAWIKILLFAKKHGEMVKKQHFDVVLSFGNTIVMNAYQSHGGDHWCSTFRKSYSEKNSLLRCVKKILIVLSLKNHARHWVESAAFRQKKLPLVIAISNMIKNDLTDYFDISPSKIELVYNGIDTEKFPREKLQKFREPTRQNFGIKEEEVVFLFVSLELKKKGIEPLIAAAEDLKKRVVEQFKILVVGGKPYPSLTRSVERKGLTQTVIFTGPTKSVQKMYAASDVFILPTYYDACSLVVLEAMVCGLPAITTETNGIAGILANGKNGVILSHPPNQSDIADKMEFLLNREERDKMAANSLELGLRYTKKKNHGTMLKLLNGVFEEG